MAAASMEQESTNEGESSKKNENAEQGKTRSKKQSSQYQASSPTLSITIRFTLQDELQLGSTDERMLNKYRNTFALSAKRNVFWFSLFKNSNYPASADLHEKATDEIDNFSESIERHLQENFPFNLKGILITRIKPKKKNVAFEVTSITYGSLDLGLDIKNVTSLLEATGMSLEAFFTLLEMSAPIALVRSVGLNDNKADLLTAEVEGPDGPQQAESVAGNISTLQRFMSGVRAAWAVLILFAILIWYLSYKDLHDVKDRMLNNYDSAFKMQLELLKLQNEVIRNIYEAKTLTDSAIPARNK